MTASNYYRPTSSEADMLAESVMDKIRLSDELRDRYNDSLIKLNEALKDGASTTDEINRLEADVAWTYKEWFDATNYCISYIEKHGTVLLDKIDGFNQNT